MDQQKLASYKEKYALLDPSELRALQRNQQNSRDEAATAINQLLAGKSAAPIDVPSFKKSNTAPASDMSSDSVEGLIAARALYKSRLVRFVNSFFMIAMGGIGQTFFKSHHFTSDPATAGLVAGGSILGLCVLGYYLGVRVTRAVCADEGKTIKQKKVILWLLLPAALATMIVGMAIFV